LSRKEYLRDRTALHSPACGDLIVTSGLQSLQAIARRNPASTRPVFPANDDLIAQAQHLGFFSEPEMAREPCPYRIEQGGYRLYRKSRKDETEIVPLSNFTAAILKARH
jgi:hypothetical protein